MSRLRWPFAESRALRTVAETARITPRRIRLYDLIEDAASETVVVDALSAAGAVQDPVTPGARRPFSSDCAELWAPLTAVGDLSKQTELVLVIIIGSQGRSDRHRARLDVALGEDPAGSVHVLIRRDPSALQTHRITRIPTCSVLDEHGIMRAINEGSAAAQELVKLASSGQTSTV